MSEHSEKLAFARNIGMFLARAFSFEKTVFCRKRMERTAGAFVKDTVGKREGKLPSAVLACVGGGSNAMGMFYEFVPDAGVRLIGCEAAGRGGNTPENAATIANGSLGIFHGMKSYCGNC